MSSSSCTLCPTTTTTNGTFVYNYDPTANIPLRNGGGSWQCADLDTRLLPFVAAEASECTAVQSVLGQGICGCSVDTATSCSLCPDGTEMPASRRVAELAFLDASVILNTTTWNPVIATMLESLQVNCALLQAFVQTTSGNGLCTTSQVLLQDFCCSADFAQPKHPCVVDTWGDDEPKVRLGRNNDDNDLDSNENNHLTLTCSQLQQAAMLWENDSQMCVLTNALATLSDCPTTPLSASSPSNAIASPCAMCRDGSAVTLPDKIVDSNLFSTTTKTESDQLNMALFAQIMDITCADLDLILQSAYTHGDDTCHQAQLMGAYCGCPTAPKPCHFCKDDQEITLPYHYHYHANKYFDISATCAQLQIGLLQYNDDSRECFLAQETNWECGCNNGFNGYLGTETSRQQRVLTWAGRASGLLGFLGAMFILLDNTILDKQGLRKKSIYRQLMCFVASLDALSALIWIVGPLPVPKTYENGLDLNVYGNRGNDASCTVQAFFAQLGYGSIYFTATLSVYYYLVVVKQWTNHDLQKARRWLFSVPAVCAIGMALVCLPFYEHAWILCYIQPYPYASKRTTTFVASTPMYLMATISTCLQLLVYCKVRKQVRKSFKWTFSSKTKFGTASSKPEPPSTGMNLKFRLPKVFVNNIEAAVFWQSLSYLSTFYLCWVVMAIISEFAHHQIWPLWVLMFLISPLPGFLNCLVYVRPRVLSWKEDRQKQRAKKNKETMTHTSATNPQDSSIGMRRDEEPDVDNVSKNKDGVAANDDANVASDETECPRIDQNTMAEALI